MCVNFIFYLFLLLHHVNMLNIDYSCLNTLNELDSTGPGRQYYIRASEDIISLEHSDRPTFRTVPANFNTECPESGSHSTCREVLELTREEVEHRTPKRPDVIDNNNLMSTFGPS